MRIPRLLIFLAFDIVRAIFDWCTNNPHFFLVGLNERALRLGLWLDDMREGENWYAGRPACVPGELLVQVSTRVEPSDWSKRRWIREDKIYILTHVHADGRGRLRTFTTWSPGPGGEQRWQEGMFFREFRRHGWSPDASE